MQAGMPSHLSYQGQIGELLRFRFLFERQLIVIVSRLPMPWIIFHTWTLVTSVMDYILIKKTKYKKCK